MSNGDDRLIGEIHASVGFLVDAVREIKASGCSVGQRQAIEIERIRAQVNHQPPPPPPKPSTNGNGGNGNGFGNGRGAGEKIRLWAGRFGLEGSGPESIKRLAGFMTTSLYRAALGTMMIYGYLELQKIKSRQTPAGGERHGPSLVERGARE
jgi:hypothetical protein